MSFRKLLKEKEQYRNKEKIRTILALFYIFYPLRFCQTTATPNIGF